MNERLVLFILQKINSIKKDIFCVEFEAKKYWVKRARATKPSKIHQFFYAFLPFELLIVGEYKTPKDALAHEVKKMQKLRYLGINIPTIIYNCEDFFVLNHTGENLHELFKNGDLSDEEFYVLVNKSLEMLARLHSLNLYHGGAQSRNFTFKNDEVFMIDFEESFSKNISKENLKFRDFLLYLLSFTKIKNRKIDYGYIINFYISLTDDKIIMNKLAKLSRLLKPLLFLSKFNLINQYLGKDVKNFIVLLEQLKILTEK